MFFAYLIIKRYEEENVSEVKIIDMKGEQKKFNFEPKTMETLMQNKALLYLSGPKVGNLGIVGGNRSYAFFGDLARLEQALTRWTLKTLINKYGFTPVVVPELIYSDIVQACGFNPFGHRTQVYSLKGDERVCLTGTAEIPLAALNVGNQLYYC